MTTLQSTFLDACETHSPDQIRQTLADGLDPNSPIKGLSPIDTLIQSYLRSNRFHDCLRLLLAAGATISSPALQAVLLDDDTTLKHLLTTEPQLVQQHLCVPSAFTSLQGATLLHVCAEYNSLRCAQALLDAGADINAPAQTNPQHIGGQTPIYHAVNSIFNFSRPTLELLVDHGANLDIRIPAFIWGPGADWETLILDASPISYAQAGLYAQFHRKEQDIYSNLACLYQKRHNAPLPIHNVPNKYLSPKKA